MKKLLTGMIVMLCAAGVMAATFTETVEFKNDVNYDKGANWKINGTKVTATAAQLNTLAGGASAFSNLTVSGWALVNGAGALTATTVTGATFRATTALYATNAYVNNDVKIDKSLTAATVTGTTTVATSLYSTNSYCNGDATVTRSITVNVATGATLVASTASYATNAYVNNNIVADKAIIGNVVTGANVNATSGFKVGVQTGATFTYTNWMGGAAASNVIYVGGGIITNVVTWVTGM